MLRCRGGHLQCSFLIVALVIRRGLLLGLLLWIRLLVLLPARDDKVGTLQISVVICATT